jgi:glycosyltransferase involved in cell wall biosynthesis
MRILALPHDSMNPYQELLYQELQSRGVTVSYIGSLTSSYTLNQLLLPLELVINRLAGARLVHLHWVYDFGPCGGGRYRLPRRVCQAWFVLWLRTLRLVGLRLVWTAHNVLPLQTVFADDLRARRQLVSHCDAVIAHSSATIEELAALGMVPRSSVVIPHGPFMPSRMREGTNGPSDSGGTRRLLFFGNIREYKGVDDLLAAFAALPPHLDARLTVAGRCDETLRPLLTKLARHSAGRVELRLERVPEDELTRLLAESQVVVLPFRRSTTSGSAVLALCHGRPVVVPDLPGLAELPDEALFRYDGTVQGLTRALTEAILAAPSRLARMSAAADAYGGSVGWDEIAERTLEAMRKVLSGDSDVRQKLAALALSATELKGIFGARAEANRNDPAGWPK